MTARQIIVRVMIALAMIAVLGIIFATQSRDPRIISITTATALDDRCRPISVTHTYAPTDTFYLAVQIANYHGDAPLIARWRSANMQPVSTTFAGDAAGEGFIGFVLHNDNAWPAGTYFVDILYHDKVLQSIHLKFESPR
jgi:hypothetical protein